MNKKRVLIHNKLLFTKLHQGKL